MRFTIYLLEMKNASPGFRFLAVISSQLKGKKGLFLNQLVQQFVFIDSPWRIINSKICFEVVVGFIGKCPESLEDLNLKN